ncbi:MAG: hypothetical protein JWP94_683 [Mucilaginibacter sp.]|nr:hypothetical protein [Mucilaginibacter sp.]
MNKAGGFIQTYFIYPAYPGEFILPGYFLSFSDGRTRYRLGFHV